AGLWNRRGLDLEAVQGLVDGEASELDAGTEIGLVAGRDLRLDECAQELVGRPALSLGGLTDSGGDGSNPGELEPAEAGHQVGCRRRRPSAGSPRRPGPGR